MKARADTKGLPAVFCCRTSSDSRPFPLAFLYSFPATSAGATSEIKAGFGKPRLLLAVYPNLEPLSDLQGGVKAPVGPASPPPVSKPSKPRPGRRGDGAEERVQSPSDLLSSWGSMAGQNYTPLFPSRAFREGLKRGNYCLHPVTGKASVFC